MVRGFGFRGPLGFRVYLVQGLGLGVYRASGSIWFRVLGLGVYGASGLFGLGLRVWNLVAPLGSASSEE